MNLESHGIPLKAAPVGSYDVDCPKEFCKQSRRGLNPTPLRVEVVTPDYAEWRCSHCFWTGHEGDPSAPRALVTQPASGETKPLYLPEQAKSFLNGLGITDPVIAEAQVAWDDERQSIKIPYRNETETFNALVIEIPEGNARLARPRRAEFYNAALITGAQDVIIAGSEIDCLRLRSCGYTNVIGFPCAHELNEDSDLFSKAAALLSGAGRVVIATDNTPEGERLKNEVARRVGIAKCWNITLSNGTVGETIRVGGLDGLCYDVNNALPFPINGLYSVQDFSDSLVRYFEGGMARGVSTQWQNVDRIYTVMPGELTVVTGVPNNGKSEWIDALTINLALAENWRFAVFSPENGKEQHVVKLVEKRVELSASPKDDDRMSLDAFMQGAAWVNDHYYFIVADDEKDLPTVDWIMEKAAAAILRYGVRGLIIDPWNEVEHQRDNRTSETDYISKALSKLKRFARNHGIHLWIVAHPNKMQTAKDGKITVPSLYDISGSANWANKTDNGIVIHRSTDIADHTEVWVKKVRFKHVGRRGVATLKYDKRTGRYSMPDHDDDKVYSGLRNMADSEIETYEA